MPLLGQLVAHQHDISEADIRRLIRANPGGDELPETTWRRLRELQIVIPIEPRGDFYLVAEPVRKLIQYLFDEAQAATPEIVRGCVDSLRVAGNQLARSIEQEDLSLLRVAIEEVQYTLRRIHSDLDETHHCILGEVARYKTERRKIFSARNSSGSCVGWTDTSIQLWKSFGPTDRCGRPSTRLRG